MAMQLHRAQATTRPFPGASVPVSSSRSGGRTWTRLVAALHTVGYWIMAEPISAPGAATPYLGAPARRWLD